MKNTIKIWPDLDVTQTLVHYSDSKINSTKTIYIDLSNVQHVSSSGAALALVKLMKIIRKYRGSTWGIIDSEDILVKGLLTSIGFYKILSENIDNKELIWVPNDNELLKPFSYENKKGFKITSFPLYHLVYNRANHREAVEDFTDFLLESMSPLLDSYGLRLNIFSKLLKEIAKNSEDHTNDNAFFGIDLVEPQGLNKSTIKFSFCDLGIGIHENIKSFISKATANGQKDVSKKFGIVDSYHRAFQLGYSTSTNLINKGLGMSMIKDCSDLLQLQLSVFDARSRGSLPENNSHSQIRRNFWDTHSPVGFYYYGTLHLKKLNERI